MPEQTNLHEWIYSFTFIYIYIYFFIYAHIHIIYIYMYVILCVYTYVNMCISIEIEIELITITVLPTVTIHSQHFALDVFNPWVPQQVLAISSKASSTTKQLMKRVFGSWSLAKCQFGWSKTHPPTTAMFHVYWFSKKIFYMKKQSCYMWCFGNALADCCIQATASLSSPAQAAVEEPPLEPRKEALPDAVPDSEEVLPDVPEDIEARIGWRLEVTTWQQCSAQVAVSSGESARNGCCVSQVMDPWDWGRCRGDFQCITLVIMDDGD